MTLLLSANVHPRVVMELLGHSQMCTTMDVFPHVMPALAREAADRMSALLLAGPGFRSSQVGSSQVGSSQVGVEAMPRVPQLRPVLGHGRA